MSVTTIPVPVAGKKSGIFYGYYILAVAFLCQFFSAGIVSYCFQSFIKPLTDAFSWNRAEIALGVTIVHGMMAITSPVVGPLSSRWGSKWVMALGGLLMSLGFILMSMMTDLTHFYLLYVIIGLGGNAAGVVPSSMVVSTWFKKRRGMAVGMLGTGIGLGGFVMPYLTSTYFIPSFGWSQAYLILGLVSLVMTPLAIFIVRQKPADMGLLPDGDTVESIAKASVDKAADAAKGKKAKRVHGETGPMDVGYTLKEAMRTPAFWFAGVSITIFSLGSSMVFQNQLPYLEGTGLSVAIAASAYGVVGAGSAVGKFFFGWLCDYIPAKFSFIIGIAFQAVGTFIMLTMKPDSSLLAIYGSSVLFGIGIGVWLPAISMITSSTFGMAYYGSIFGIMAFLFYIAGAIGPLIAGRIYDLQGSYNTAFIGTLICFAVSAPLILLILHPKKR